ncbi:hypothetical protein H8D51_01215 [bacterium]|nr:hypothetical protein [bacterium]
MEHNGLIPVLQLCDLDALKAARVHLQHEGFETKIVPFAELPETERQDWMTPKDGGYLFYLEQARHEPAMEMLGKFFGCT